MNSTSVTNAQSALAVIVGTLQLYMLPSDFLCGLSGADSVLRAFAATVDATAGALFLIGVYTFVRKPAHNSRYFLKRWSKLQSSSPEDIKAGLKVDVRAMRLPKFTTTTRVGRISVAPVPTRP
jgi:hypothetical protein